MHQKFKSNGLVVRKLASFMAIVWFALMPGYAQETLIDSLKQQLNTELSAEDRVYCLLSLYEAIYYTDLETSRDYLDQALELSLEVPDKHYHFDALLAKVMDLTFQEVALDSVVPLLIETMELAKSLEYDYGIASVYYELGRAYNYANQNDLAFSYFQEGLEVFEQVNDPENAIWYLNPMGNILHEKGDRDEAYFYYQKGVEMATGLRDSSWLSLFYNNMAEVHREKVELEDAVFFYHKAMQISNNEWDSCLVYANLGMVFTENGEFELAEKNLERAKQLGLQHDLKEELCNVYLRWGDWYMAKGLHEKAFEEYEHVEALILQYTGDLPKANIQYYRSELFLSKAKAYESLDDPEKALSFYKKHHAIQDSLYDEQKRELILNLDSRYKIEQKQMKNKLLRADSAVYKTRIRERSLLVLAIVIISLLFFGLAFKLFLFNRDNRRYALRLEAEVKARTEDILMTNVKLQKSNSELESFASITSHDLKEPLRTIAGFTSYLEGNLEKESYDNMAAPIGFIKLNVQRMFRLIEDILAYSSLEQKTPLNLIHFEEIQNHVLESLQTLIKEKNAQINFETETQALEELRLPSQLKIVFKNLIENGLKYNEDAKPGVSVSYASTEGTHQFIFKDNGIGIDEQYHDTIFKMFKRLHTREEYGGTGIGLAICQKIVENLGGKLFLRHSDENGSEFFLEIRK